MIGYCAISSLYITDTEVEAGTTITTTTTGTSNVGGAIGYVEERYSNKQDDYWKITNSSFSGLTLTTTGGTQNIGGVIGGTGSGYGASYGTSMQLHLEELDVTSNTITATSSTSVGTVLGRETYSDTSSSHDAYNYGIYGVNVYDTDTTMKISGTTSTLTDQRGYPDVGNTSYRDLRMVRFTDFGELVVSGVSLWPETSDTDDATVLYRSTLLPSILEDAPMVNDDGDEVYEYTYEDDNGAEVTETYYKDADGNFTDAEGVEVTDEDLIASLKDSAVQQINDSYVWRTVTDEDGTVSEELYYLLYNTEQSAEIAVGDFINEISTAVLATGGTEQDVDDNIVVSSTIGDVQYTVYTSEKWEWSEEKGDAYAGGKGNLTVSGNSTTGYTFKVSNTDTVSDTLVQWTNMHAEYYVTSEATASAYPLSVETDIPVQVEMNISVSTLSWLMAGNWLDMADMLANGGTYGDTEYSASDSVLTRAKEAGFASYTKDPLTITDDGQYSAYIEFAYSGDRLQLDTINYEVDKDGNSTPYYNKFNTDTGETYGVQYVNGVLDVWTETAWQAAVETFKALYPEWYADLYYDVSVTTDDDIPSFDEEDYLYSYTETESVDNEETGETAQVITRYTITYEAVANENGDETVTKVTTPEVVTEAETTTYYPFDPDSGIMYDNVEYIESTDGLAFLSLADWNTAVTAFEALYPVWYTDADKYAENHYYNPTTDEKVEFIEDDHYSKFGLTVEKTLELAAPGTSITFPQNTIVYLVDLENPDDIYVYEVTGTAEKEINFSDFTLMDGGADETSYQLVNVLELDEETYTFYKTNGSVVTDASAGVERFLVVVDFQFTGGIDTTDITLEEGVTLSGNVTSQIWTDKATGIDALTDSDGDALDYSNIFTIDSIYNSMQSKVNVSARRTLEVTRDDSTAITFSNQLPLSVDLTLTDEITESYDQELDIINAGYNLDVVYEILDSNGDKVSTDGVTVYYYDEDGYVAVEKGSESLMYMSDLDKTYSLDDAHTDEYGETILIVETDVSITIDFSSALENKLENGATYTLRVYVYRIDAEGLKSEIASYIDIPITVATSDTYGLRIDVDSGDLNMNLNTLTLATDALSLPFTLNVSNADGTSETTVVEYRLYYRGDDGTYQLYSPAVSQDEAEETIADSPQVDVAYSADRSVTYSLEEGTVSTSLWYYDIQGSSGWTVPTLASYETYTGDNETSTVTTQVGYVTFYIEGNAITEIKVLDVNYVAWILSGKTDTAYDPGTVYDAVADDADLTPVQTYLDTLDADAYDVIPTYSSFSSEYDTLEAAILAANGIERITRPTAAAAGAVYDAVALLLGDDGVRETIMGAGDLGVVENDLSNILSDLPLGNYRLEAVLKVNEVEVAEDFFIFNVNRNVENDPIQDG